MGFKKNNSGRSKPLNNIRWPSPPPKRLESIPDVGRKSAWLLLCLLRAQHFQWPPQVAAFLGLVPVSTYPAPASIGEQVGRKAAMLACELRCICPQWSSSLTTLPYECSIIACCKRVKPKWQHFVPYPANYFTSPLADSNINRLIMNQALTV